MMNVNIIAMGKLKESYYREACAEYLKRLGAFASVKVYEPQPVDLPQNPNRTQIDKALEQEAARIRENIRPGSFTIAMCIEGKAISSEQLAQKLEDIANRGISTVNFIVGSSFGLAEELKTTADMRMSMSPMTFPHSLARVMLSEQIYRAYSIINNAKYHK
ncbi:MAG: 23S rRNA (pseudouridine(1915)-N(3))-methyltransferase RlmH [Oscillospiraceae bacterium]